jgi:integrase/recombinase XerD
MVHSLCQIWLDHLHQQGKSQHTLDAYQRALRHFARWNEASSGTEFEPARVIGRDVRDWKAYQQTVERARPATINQRLTALSRFFAWAVQQGHLRVDPTRGTQGLQLSARQPKALDDRALRRLLRRVQAEGSKRDVAIVEVLAGTGLRVSELLALKVGDVEVRERSGQVTVRHGKRGGYREVPIPREARQALTAYLEDHPGRDDLGASLWLGQRGPLMDRAAIKRLLDRYARLEGIVGLSPHALRHTFATRYLAANPDDLRGLAALLGHRNLNTVMIYTEPTQESLAERVERMS